MDKIEDTFSVRKIDGKFLININEDNSPISIIRQLSDNELEVYLRTGHMYVHKTDGDLFQCILQMCGYIKVKAKFEVLVFDSKSRMDTFPTHNIFASEADLLSNLNDVVCQSYSNNVFAKNRVVNVEYTLINIFDKSNIDTSGEISSRANFDLSFYCHATHVGDVIRSILTTKISSEKYDYLHSRFKCLERTIEV